MSDAASLKLWAEMQVILPFGAKLPTVRTAFLIPEKEQFDEQDLIETILSNRLKGKKHHVVINAEGIGDSNRLAKRIETATGIETRATILGHIQRGGSPTAKDRVIRIHNGCLCR